MTDLARIAAVAALSATLQLGATPGFAQNRDPGWPDAARDGASESQGWHFELVPYVWASGVKGTVGLRGRTVEVDVRFRDLLKHLSGALTLAAGARHGPWTIGSEVIWIRLANQRGTPGPLFSGAELGASQLMFELTGRYRMIDAAPVTVDVFVGGRYWHLSNTLTLEPGALPGQEFKLTQSWFDPIVGLSGVAELSEHWLVQARGDIGGFDIGSDRTWQALGLIGYRISRTVAVAAGYRYLAVDFLSENNGFLYDVGTSGPIVGVTIRF